MVVNASTPLHIAILGIRGVPARHGGFESFAERLAPFLVQAGHRVTVYCQEDGQGPVTHSDWQGVERVHIPSGQDTAMASIRFDAACITQVRKLRPDVVLMLGYNTAAFAWQLKLARIPTVINMDGIEYSRAKWGPAAKAWLFLNERLGCWWGDHLVADHPVIADHLATRAPRHKITTIPYGGDVLQGVSPAPLASLGLRPGSFVTVIARPEPENSILEIVRAFSARTRGVRLVVLGKYDVPGCRFRQDVLAAASGEVMFPGAIYDAETVQALRAHSLFYVHGHQVGGTNPSLLEAMGAGNAVLAHDNPFNRWVLGSGGLFFRDRASCAVLLDRMLSGQADLASMRRDNQARVGEVFVWQQVLSSYLSLLTSVARQVSTHPVVLQDRQIWTQHTT